MTRYEREKIDEKCDLVSREIADGIGSIQATEIVSELKPCPFCGSKSKTKKGFQNIDFFVCTNSKCGAITSFRDISVIGKSDPVSLFNRREIAEQA